MSWSSGRCGARIGAATATTTKSSRMLPPTAALLLRRRVRPRSLVQRRATGGSNVAVALLVAEGDNASIRRPLPVPDPRIEAEVADVNEGVDRHEDGGED